MSVTLPSPGTGGQDEAVEKAGRWAEQANEEFTVGGRAASGAGS